MGLFVQPQSSKKDLFIGTLGKWSQGHVQTMIPQGILYHADESKRDERGTLLSVVSQSPLCFLAFIAQLIVPNGLRNPKFTVM